MKRFWLKGCLSLWRSSFTEKKVKFDTGLHPCLSYCNCTRAWKHITQIKSHFQCKFTTIHITLHKIFFGISSIILITIIPWYMYDVKKNIEVQSRTPAIMITEIIVRCMEKMLRWQVVFFDDVSSLYLSIIITALTYL